MKLNCHQVLLIRSLDALLVIGSLPKGQFLFLFQNTVVNLSKVIDRGGWRCRISVLLARADFYHTNWTKMQVGCIKTSEGSK